LFDFSLADELADKLLLNWKSSIQIEDKRLWHFVAEVLEFLLLFADMNKKKKRVCIA
jgi:hypothetical protein